MARKRDYKAEYAARKARAQKAGYKSVRDYSATRKALNLPRNASPIPKRVLSLEGSSPRISRLRAESRAWSNAHSHRKHSRYSDSLTDAQVERYWRAYVEDIDLGTQRKTDFAKRMRIKEYLVPDFLADEQEWKANPSTVPLRR